MTELWAAYTPAYFDLKEQGKVVELANVLVDGGVEGWWIPQYLAEEHPERRPSKASSRTPNWLAAASMTALTVGCNFTNNSI